MSCVLQDWEHEAFYLFADIIIILVLTISASKLDDLNTKLLTSVLLSPGPETEPILVDASAPRWQTLEPEQLPHRYDPGTWWSGRNPGAYSLQGYLLPHMGGSFLVRETLMWPCLANGSSVVHQVESLAQAILILLRLFCFSVITWAHCIVQLRGHLGLGYSWASACKSMEISLHETIFPAPSVCVPYLYCMWHVAVWKWGTYYAIDCLPFLGRRPVALRSPWSGRSWRMPRDQVWTKFQTEDSPCGGLLPSTEPT